MERIAELPSDQTISIARKEIIAWWESRRLRFNVYVGSIGVVSWLLVWFAGSAAVRLGVDFEEPIAMIFVPIIFGVLANACYTLGWIVDIVFYRGMPRTHLYRAGVVFSVVLAALPGAWGIVAWVMTLITGRKLA